MKNNLVLIGEFSDAGIDQKVEYDPNTSEYLVTVAKVHEQGKASVLTSRFLATYEPKFGPDVGDLMMAEQVADELIQKLP